jgi:hypothetical protein
MIAALVILAMLADDPRIVCRDTAGNAKTVSVGTDLNWTTTFDEAGNVKTAQEPGDRGEASMKHNAASAVTTEKLADGASQSHDYYNTGSGKAFTDPGTTPETTSVITDNLGRPLVITYEADGTTQEIHYQGARVLAVKDRQERWQSFFYENGHLTEIWAAANPKSGNQLDKIDYDGAGRVIHWTTPDAKIDYDNFTLDGLPRHTRQTRYKDHSGLGAQVELDHFDQSPRLQRPRRADLVQRPGVAERRVLPTASPFTTTRWGTPTR